MISCWEETDCDQFRDVNYVTRIGFKGDEIETWLKGIYKELRPHRDEDYLCITIRNGIIVSVKLNVDNIFSDIDLTQHVSDEWAEDLFEYLQCQLTYQMQNSLILQQNIYLANK